MAGGAEGHRHGPSMRCAHETVNGYWNPKHDDAQRVIECQRNLIEKKPGSKEPGLRYWPIEADTITFQEGLLNRCFAGGGGQSAEQRLSTPSLWCAAMPRSKHPSRMSVMRKLSDGSNVLSVPTARGV